MIALGNEIVSLYKSVGKPWSRFAYLWLYKNKSLLVHSLTSTTIVLDKDTSNRFRKGHLYNSEIEFLKENRFVIEKDSDDDELITKIKIKVEQHLSNTPITTLFLIVTDNCNLSCSYCYENLNIYSSKKYMQYELMIDSIEKFLNSKSINEPKIFFYGGEPLLNWKNIKKTIKYVRKNYDSNINLQITTNGTLYQKELCELAKKYNVGIAISLDGPKEINDLARKWRRSSISVFDSAFYLLKLCQETKIDYSVLCTIGPHNAEFINEISHYFIRELNVEKITYNLLLRRPEEEIINNPEFWDKLGKSVAKNYLMMMNENVFEARTLRYITGLVENTFTISECDAGYGSQIVVHPNGKIGPCQGFLYDSDYWKSVPNYSDVKHFDLWQRFYRSNTLTMPKCSECPLQGTCGGGCHYNRKSFFSPNDNFCQYMISLVYTLAEVIIK